ncbi:DUF3857 domain-containing transglutaminase family protein [Lacinutrix sp.]|uniref:DUF3857 domain-containing transglutaminase family protein n=1 Tax=Lacinutrix sp. TaxID=1937692 RepID=UPI0025BD6D86|nr:DUF3857 domain-containing transglutaminase family protein [Lacinutrix sp.]
MRNTLIINLLIAFFTITVSTAQVATSPVPNWINTIDYSLTPDISADDITQGTSTLFYDYQTHIPKQETYSKFVTKITDNVGVQDASSISVGYDPKYQKLTFHEIYILRDQEKIDKLQPENFQVLRRETNAENNLYDGSMSAVLNLTDVRTDDIVAYSYTILGFNPIHKGKFSHSYYFNNYESIGQISVTLFSKNELNYKAFNTDLKPEINTKNNLTTYFWNNKNTKRIEYEDNTPNWKLEGEIVYVSEYKSWEEVINWGIDTYTLNEKPNTALIKTIKNIEKSNKTEGEKIKAALEFVQNEIRYLGLEDGIGAYKPFTPNKVLNQRFGDCKDKSLMLSVMLKEMGIKAYPMLVNTSLKHTITEILPSPVFFDHCVIKVIDKDEREIYYDPTITNQGGTYDNVYFPNYKYGLVLKPNTKAFDTIYTAAVNMVEVQDEYFLEAVGKGAKLKVTTIYHENEADGMRNYFKNNSINSISKEYEKFYANYYFDIASLKNPEISDNEKENLFTVIEEYKIDSLWRPMEDKKGYIAAYFTPSTLQSILYVPNKKERKNEIDLYYPTIKEHKIKVHLPEAWDIEKSEQIISSKAFYYTDEVKYNNRKNILDLKYYLKMQNDYLETQDLSTYIKDAKKVNNALGYSIFIPESGTDFDDLDSMDNLKDGLSTLLEMLVYAALIVSLLFALIYFLFYRVKRD